MVLRAGTWSLLQVDTAAALAAGVRFHRADNGVWLSAAVPAMCLALADPSAA